MSPLAMFSQLNLCFFLNYVTVCKCKFSGPLGCLECAAWITENYWVDLENWPKHVSCIFAKSRYAISEFYAVSDGKFGWFRVHSGNTWLQQPIRSEDGGHVSPRTNDSGAVLCLTNGSGVWQTSLIIRLGCCCWLLGLAWCGNLPSHSELGHGCILCSTGGVYL